MKKIILSMAVLLCATIALCDKSSVEIIAPMEAKIGETIQITINVKHKGNNFFHHTSWAYIKVNGKEVARFKYPFKKENFSRTITYKVIGNVKIEAQANCNFHGSAGKRFININVK